jgi:hypothetical protein
MRALEETHQAAKAVPGQSRRQGRDGGEQAHGRRDIARLVRRVEAVTLAASRKECRRARRSPRESRSRADRRSIRGLLHEVEACYACASGFTSVEVLAALMAVGFVGLALLGHDVTGLLSGFVSHLLGSATASVTAHGSTGAGLVVAPRLRPLGTRPQAAVRPAHAVAHAAADGLYGLHPGVFGSWCLLVLVAGILLVLHVSAPRLLGRAPAWLRSLVGDMLAAFLLCMGAGLVCWMAALPWDLGPILANAGGLWAFVVGLAGGHELLVLGAIALLALLSAAPVFPSQPALAKTHDERLAGTEERGWLVCHLLIVAVGLVFLGLATGAIPTGHTDLLGGVISHLMGSGSTGMPSAASISGVMGR